MNIGINFPIASSSDGVRSITRILAGAFAAAGAGVLAAVGWAADAVVGAAAGALVGAAGAAGASPPHAAKADTPPAAPRMIKRRVTFELPGTATAAP